jgi:hypothetical protein
MKAEKKSDINSLKIEVKTGVRLRSGSLAEIVANGLQHGIREQ